VMSIPDKVMPIYARLVTNWKPDQVNRFEAGLETESLHPRDAKMQLAHAITSTFYSLEAADAAQTQFVTLFQKGDVPESMPEHVLVSGESVLDIMLGERMAESRSQARRLIEQQGVRLDGVTVADGAVQPEAGSVLQVGKRRFLRIIKAD